MAGCTHPRFRYLAEMRAVRSEEVHVSESVIVLKAWCDSCGAPYGFKAPQGFSTAGPTTSASGELLFIPVLRPPVQKDEPAHPSEPN